MKPALCLLASLSLASVSALAQGQGGRQQQPGVPQAPLAPKPPPNVALTPQQMEVITKQLAETTKMASDLRSAFLKDALETLRSKGASEAAALNYYQDCERLVSMERKEMKRDAIQERVEAMERKSRRDAELKEDIDQGHFATAVQLHIQYLILSLEASETPPDQRGPLMQRLQTYIKDVVDKAPKLRGRSGASMNSLGGTIVAAMQLQGYLKAKDWSPQPFDLRQIWQQCIIPYMTEFSPESLVTQWDSYIAAESAYQKGRLPGPEFEIWGQQELPRLRWDRARFLYESGPEPIKGLAEMLAHIKTYPAHPDARQWLDNMTTAIEAAQTPKPTP